jgi:hypothetical protein
MVRELTVALYFFDSIASEQVGWCSGWLLILELIF